MSNKSLWIIIPAALVLLAASIFSAPRSDATEMKKGSDLMETKPEGYPTAIFAGGCFWCTESEYRRQPGVLFTRVGYIGGHIDNPKYEDTHDSKSGHAEAVEVTYDPKLTTYKALVEFFMKDAHDPTQLNRQGPDVGTQYRSAIFYHNDEEKQVAQSVIDALTAEKYYDKPIVTTLEPATKFWEAEDYHQQYFEKYEEKNGKPHMTDWLHRQKAAK